MNPLELANRMSEYGFAAATESVLHDAVQEFFRQNAIEFVPEHSLSARERIDFYVPDGKIGVECKVDGSTTEVMRQLLRYTESPAIDGLTLVTSRNKHRGIPPTLGGKPVVVVLTRAF